LPILVDQAAKTELKEISVVSESIPHLRRGAIKDFKKIMFETGRWRAEGWNSTLLTYRFSNGSFIEFFSADQEEKLRGARRQVLYINECNNITFEAYHQLAIRTSEDIWLDFNPTAEFWAHTEVLKEPDSELLILNYLDNEALPDTIKGDIEQAREKAKTSEYWANWWRVYGLGQVGTLQGAVFDNWEQVDDIDRANSKFIAIGLDWGFTNDPTAVIAAWKNGDDIYFEELIYERNLTNQDIASKLKSLGITRSWEIIADSAEPKSIEEVYRLGFNIHPSKK
jgi:phage terminase large subunit